MCRVKMQMTRGDNSTANQLTTFVEALIGGRVNVDAGDDQSTAFALLQGEAIRQAPPPPVRWLGSRTTCLKTPFLKADQELNQSDQVTC